MLCLHQCFSTLAGKFWELKFTHFAIAEVEKHWSTLFLWAAKQITKNAKLVWHDLSLTNPCWLLLTSISIQVLIKMLLNTVIWGPYPIGMSNRSIASHTFLISLFGKEWHLIPSSVLGTHQFSTSSETLSRMVLQLPVLIQTLDCNPSSSRLKFISILSYTLVYPIFSYSLTDNSNQLFERRQLRNVAFSESPLCHNELTGAVKNLGTPPLFPREAQFAVK